MNQPSAERHWMLTIVYGLLAILLLLTIAINFVRLSITLQDSATEPESPTLILERAQDAVQSAELILSFLEGATVLITLAFGAATIVGYRNARELRTELDEKLAEIEKLRQTIDQQLTQALPQATREIRQDFREEVAKVENLRERAINQLQMVDERLDTAEGTVTQAVQRIDTLESSISAERAKLEAQKIDIQQEIENIQPIMVDLFQATQELNLKNYEQAYRVVNRVIERTQHTRPNVQALYIGGWLELQYIPGKLDDGLAHLRQALDLAGDSPSIQAAYGVGLRRKALTYPADAPERRKLFMEAESKLLGALAQNENLIDLNRESFYGPLAGIKRDTGSLEEAIHYYERASRVTAGSSYPMGNVAALRLQAAQRATDPEERAHILEQALNEFAATADYAERELSYMPGDYFLMMDVSTAMGMLGFREATNFEESNFWLDRALATNPTCGMLQVSLRGWQRIQQALPDVEAWQAVRDHVAQVNTRLQATLSAMGCD